MINLDILKHDIQLKYDDLEWDTMNPTERDSLALSQLIKTTLFAKENIPFYQKHLKNNTMQDIERISSLEEYGIIIPETTKLHMSFAGAESFISDYNIFQFDNNKGGFRNKPTGGSTGRPITMIFSTQDWNAMSKHIARSLKFDNQDNLDYFKGIKVLGLYHGDHVTNEIYQAGLVSLGAEFFDRVSTRGSPEDIYDFIQQIKPNAILAPPEDSSNKQTKGITLDKILKIDARNSDKNAYRLNHKHNPDFKMILWSSMPISPDLQNYILNHLKIPYQQAQYGSTEVCPTSATCRKYPRDFHLGYGPTVTLLKHHTENRLSKENEDGYVLVSKTGGTTKEGVNIVPTGTTLLNYRTGDYAKMKQTNGYSCECGRNTPVLYKIHRVEEKKGKLEMGCSAH